MAGRTGDEEISLRILDYGQMTADQLRLHTESRRKLVRYCEREMRLHQRELEKIERVLQREFRLEAEPANKRRK